MYHKIKKHLDEVNRMLEKHKDKLNEVHDEEDEETSPEDELAGSQREGVYKTDMASDEEGGEDYSMDHEDEEQDKQLIREMMSKKKKNKTRGMFA